MENKKEENIKKAMDTVVKAFQNPETLPKAIAIAMFPAKNLPCALWTTKNRALFFLQSKEIDGRGYQQWKQVGRNVIKGAKAYHIFTPKMVTKKETVIKDNVEVEEKSSFLAGFFPIPVFSISQTQGDEVCYENVELPNFPLLKKAKEWGISVKAVPSISNFHGIYFHGKKQILMATPSERVFFHELSHAARKIVLAGEKWEKNKEECIAELCAATLCQFYGRELEYLKNSYEYILGYAGKKDIGKVCLNILGEVEKSVKLIVE